MRVDPLTYLFSLEQFGIKFGLDNIRALMEALGRPELSFRSVHVAGTNGKGSVTAMVESVLRAAGVHTGRYTSPHLVHLTERFAVDGLSVDEPTLRQCVGDVRDAVERLQAERRLDVHPTFFEVTTAAAFHLFRQAAVDVAVCEVGLGGRLDATNVLSPMATAITSIGLDHQQYLGATVDLIAAEKGGIIKPDTPVIVGRLPPAADAVIAQVAREMGAPLVRAHEAVHTQLADVSPDGHQRFSLRTPAHDYGVVELALAGAHQIDNAIVAVRTLETIAATESRITLDAVHAGLAQVSWPGRLQRIARPGGRTVLLDAAHNPDGAETLAAYLAAQGPIPLVFAAMHDKDAEGILQALRPVISAIVLTRASHPRSADPHELAAVAGRVLGSVPTRIAPGPGDALEIAWTFGATIVVAGSIFLLGDVMKTLETP